MKTKKQTMQIFLVLVPHRDTRFILRKYSAGLFKAGFQGAFQFPWVVPVAELSSRFNEDELKHCARVYREMTGKDKISASQSAAVEFSDEISLFGPRFEIEIPQDIFCESAALKIKNRISPSVIGSCILNEQIETLQLKLPSAESVSFRAAAFANMYWKPLKTNSQDANGAAGGAFGFKWKIGKLFWLPVIEKT